eukprot:SAG11_NODE_676_length_7798_cov_33.772438_2_plen_54_part_00
MRETLLEAASKPVDRWIGQAAPPRERAASALSPSCSREGGAPLQCDVSWDIGE